MPLDNTEYAYFERQVSLARAIFAALSLVALLETSTGRVRTAAVVFLFSYLALAMIAELAGPFRGETRFRIPLVVDFLALAVFLYLTPSVSAFWFLFLFAVFALAVRGNTRAMLAFVAVSTVAIILRVAAETSTGFEVGFQNGREGVWQGVWRWVAIGAGTLVSGLGMGFLGAREREHLSRQQFLQKITGVLRFDRGLTESIRQALGELALEFQCEQVFLAIRDDELERVFVWRVRTGDRESRAPDTLPLARAETYLIDSLEVSLCWEFKNGSGEGFGWGRRTGERVKGVPAPPSSSREELEAGSLLAVSVEMGGLPTGRFLLVNPQPVRRKFSASDLRWFEQIVRHIAPPLENIFLLRSLRARAIESERSRISRDLHDGILQTLLSLKIQLGVLAQTLPQKPEQAAEDLGRLQNTVQQESDELRRMVTDLRPLRVESADLRELMFGFAERFRLEHGLAIDLFIEDRDLHLPDRICRELFQIYRESLHNVKKHAEASHVVVKLKQDETKVLLVVDDNGRGFSFSGSYASEELDRLRLGPISIKERTRSVGGALTVESNPGHGARLTVEIPFN
jgi:signal transduction histidine kinase